MKTAKVLSALVICMMIVSSIPLFASAQEANDTLVIALQQDMLSMNPWDPDTNDVWKSNQIGWCFESLVAYNPDFELYPVLAEPDAAGPNGVDAVILDLGGDQTKVSVGIRDGITFHDGEVMDAQDIVFSYQTLGWGLFQTQVLGPLYWDEEMTFERYDGGVTKIGVELNATDDTRVDFYLNGPYAMFWYSTMGLPIMPHHIWSAHVADMDQEDYTGYNVTDEKSWDYGYGSDSAETDATIGTGPMYLDSWTPEQGAVIKAYEDYWDKEGTTIWGGEDYPNYPLHVKTIKFKIFTQLDVAILALQNGEVHHLPWSLTTGYYNQLKTDPNIGIETPKDQGFFFMTFNMRKGAMADVDFRRAVAYAVDKQYIVDRLMGGYGIQGTVPISVTNNLYVNTSAPAWIQGGDLAAAEALLDSAGYTDQDGDGWRDMPDGSPLKYNILTPPKDYDPIRADSGIMIEKNLKSIGLNIAAVPTSFDTIASAGFVSLDFDMFILGWSVGSFPESYMRDFFHSSTDVAKNPAGSNSGGYSNATVDAMIDQMETEMDTEDRAQLIKDICGATMMDVAYDTLYYRTNIEAYRADIWQGWIPAFGTIYNGFSLFNLAPPVDGGDDGGDGSGGGSTTLTGIEGAINAPSYAGAGESISGSIVAADILDVSGTMTSEPSDGASVHITTSLGDDISTTTNSDGAAFFDIDLPYQRINNFTIYANISHSGAWTNVHKVVGVEFTNHIAMLSLSTDDGVIAPDATTTVTAVVTDENNNPLVGVDVTVDTALMFGTVDEATKATNADGIATFEYTAPPVSMLPNTHRYEQFKATISVEDMIVPEIQSSSLIIGISSDTYDWHDLDVVDVTDYVLDNDAATAFMNYTWITVELTDSAGVAIDGEDVTMNLSKDGTVVDADAMVVATDATGHAVFNVSVDTAFTGAASVVATFSTAKAYTIKDSVALLIRNDPTFTQDMYHLNVTSVSTDEIWNTNSSATNTTTIDVVLYDDAWEPVNNTVVYMGLSDDSLVEVSGESNITDAWGNATFNITCVTNGSADLAIAFSIMDGIGMFEGYNLMVNKTPAAIDATTEEQEMIFGPSQQNDQYWHDIANAPVDDATVKVFNGGTWTDLTAGVDYTIDLVTGNISYINTLNDGDYVGVWYNYTTGSVVSTITDAGNESIITGATGGETGPWFTASPNVYNMTLYADEGTGPFLMVLGTDYTLDSFTGEINTLWSLGAGTDMYAYYNYSTVANAGNKTIITGATGGETGPWYTANAPVCNMTLYADEGTGPFEMVLGTDYTLDSFTGEINTLWTLSAGTDMYAYYNYSSPEADAGNESIITGATGGETGPWYTTNAPVLDMTLYADEGTGPFEMVLGTDYTLDSFTGEINTLWTLSAGTDMYAYYNYTPTSVSTMVTTSVANETVFEGPAVAGETGVLGTLTNTPIVDYNVYKENGGTKTYLAGGDYSIDTGTGDYTQITPLENGDNIYAFYNWTQSYTHHEITAVADTHIIDNNPHANATPATSHITVNVADTGGNPIDGKDVYAFYMNNDGIVTLDHMWNTTDANGKAQFNVTSMSNDEATVTVYFQLNDTVGFIESVTLWNAEYVPMYAATVNFDLVADHDSTVEVSGMVWDESGNPAEGAVCQYFIPPTAEGIPGMFDGGDSWYWEEYGSSWDLGDWAGYIGSWYGNNTMLGATTTDAMGYFNATMDTASFTADVAIPLQFAVGGTGVTEAFNSTANGFWAEYYPSAAPPLSDNDAVFYWEEGQISLDDQAILKRAPLATLTSVAMDQAVLLKADNTSTVTLTFQDLTGALDGVSVNFGEGTASPDIMDEADTAEGVYTYDYTYETDSPDFDAGIGFTSVVTDSGYAKFPFNFYLPYLATGTDAQTMVVNVEAASYSLDMGDNITLDVLVTDEYGRLMDGVALDAGDDTATTDANGEATLTIPTADVTDAGIYTMTIDAAKGGLATEEQTSVILVSTAEPAPEMVEIVVGPVVDVDGNPIEGATVTVTYDGVNYTGTTNATGHAVIEVPETALGEDVSIAITADGYEDTTYTTALNADGTLADAPPAVNAAEDDGGTDMTWVILIIVVILVVVVLLVMMSKKGGEPEAETLPEEEPPMEEPVEEEPPMEEPVEEPPMEEPVEEPPLEEPAPELEPLEEPPADEAPDVPAEESEEIPKE